MYWYFHFLKNFLQFVVIYTVKSFSVVNEAEVDVLLELLCFLHDPTNVGNLISGSSTFSKTSLNIRKFKVHILLLILDFFFLLVNTTILHDLQLVESVDANMEEP